MPVFYLLCNPPPNPIDPHPKKTAYLYGKTKIDKKVFFIA